MVAHAFNPSTWDASGAAVTDAFLEGFRRMEAACAPLGLKVYKGAELRFDECSNDYLLYNYPDELLACPEELFRMGIAAFAPLAREAQAVQAACGRRLLAGLAAGAVCFLLILAVGLLMGDGFTPGAQMLVELAGCLCGGAVAGVFGGRKGKKKRASVRKK